MKIDKPGVYALALADYLGDCCIGPSLSASGAVEIMRSCPARFWHDSYFNLGRIAESSGAADVGSAAHLLLLEPHLFDERVTVIDADSYRTKAAREQRDTAYAAGKIPILADQAEEIEAMAAALRAHPVAAPAFRDAQAEQTFIWCEGPTWCKARPDIIPASGDYLIDYKTVPSANPRAFERHAFDRGFHQQAAFHLAGVTAVTGEMPREYWYIAQEREPPYLVSVCKLSTDAVEWGARLNRKALEIFQRCVERNEWPGYRDPDKYRDHAFDIGIPGYAVWGLQEREDRGEFKLKPEKEALRLAYEAQAPLEDA